MKKYNVYGHYNLSTGECFYIGKGLSGREKDTRNRNKFWRNYVEKHGGFDTKLLAEGISHEDAISLEKSLISQYGRRAFGEGCLVNLTLGGEGREGFGLYGADNPRFGKKMPDDIKIKFGRDVSGDKNPMFGRTQSLESREKMSVTAKNRYRDGAINPLKGRKRPEAGDLGRRFSKRVCQVKDGIVVAEYASLNEASRITGFLLSNISGCCNGRLKTYKGFGWRFVAIQDKP